MWPANAVAAPHRLWSEPRALQTWLKKGPQKFWEYDTSNFKPTRIVVKMRRSASDRRSVGRARCAKGREYSGTAHIFITEAAPFPENLTIAAETAQVTQRYVHLLAEFIRRNGECRGFSV